MTTTMAKRRKLFSVMLSLLILTASLIYVTYETWSVSDKRITDDHGEPLFRANNTPAYEDNLDWPSFLGLIVSFAMGALTIFAVCVNIGQWFECKGPYLFPSGNKVRRKDNDEEE